MRAECINQLEMVCPCSCWIQHYARNLRHALLYWPERGKCSPSLFISMCPVFSALCLRLFQVSATILSLSFTVLNTTTLVAGTLLADWCIIDVVGESGKIERLSTPGALTSQWIVDQINESSGHRERKLKDSCGITDFNYIIDDVTFRLKSLFFFP